MLHCRCNWFLTSDNQQPPMWWTKYNGIRLIAKCCHQRADRSEPLKDVCATTKHFCAWRLKCCWSFAKTLLQDCLHFAQACVKEAGIKSGQITIDCAVMTLIIRSVLLEGLCTLEQIVALLLQWYFWVGDNVILKQSFWNILSSYSKEKI